MTSPMIVCPDLGVWRSWLDGEAFPDGLDRHLDGCQVCHGQVAELRANADFAASAIGSLSPREGVASSARMAGALLAVPANPASGATKDRQPPFRRWRVALGGLAASLALTLIFATPEGQAAAAAFLAQFRGQRLAVVTLDPAFNRNPMSELERLGTVDQGRRSRPEEVKTLAEAAQRAGFTLKMPDPSTMPAGLKPDPKIAVSSANELRFTFDRDKTRAYLRSVGRSDISVPDKFHGAKLVARIPTAVLIQYESANGRDLGLAIGQAGEVTAGVEGGVGLDELRDFLLGLPNLPPNVAAQLRGIKDWRTTLPIPVRPEKMNWQPTRVDGVDGILLADNSGLGSAVMWPKDGKVYGVIGSGKAPEVLRVANGLR